LRPETPANEPILSRVLPEPCGKFPTCPRSVRWPCRSFASAFSTGSNARLIASISLGRKVFVDYPSNPRPAPRRRSQAASSLRPSQRVPNDAPRALRRLQPYTRPRCGLACGLRIGARETASARSRGSAGASLSFGSGMADPRTERERWRVLNAGAKASARPQTRLLATAISRPCATFTASPRARPRSATGFARGMTAPAICRSSRVSFRIRCADRPCRPRGRTRAGHGALGMRADSPQGHAGHSPAGRGRSLVCRRHAEGLRITAAVA
jgi:hypothetical protein